MNKRSFIINYLRIKFRLLSFISKKKAGNKAFRRFCTPFFRTTYDEKLLENTQRITFNFYGLQTVGHQWNKGGGKKVLIIHGFLSASVNFKHFAEKLVGKDYEVIAFDAPGHGLSEGKMLNAITYKEFIKAIIQHFGPFDAFLSHSFGGLAISLCLEEMPDNALLKTVLIAPAANIHQICEDFLKQIRLNSPKAKKHFYTNSIRLSGKPMEWFNLNRTAESIKGPVLWVHDRNDYTTPIKDALALQQEKLSNFQFLFTKNLGHRKIYRDENVLATIINFL